MADAVDQQLRDVALSLAKIAVGDVGAIFDAELAHAIANAVDTATRQTGGRKVTLELVITPADQDRKTGEVVMRVWSKLNPTQERTREVWFARTSGGEDLALTTDPVQAHFPGFDKPPKRKRGAPPANGNATPTP